MYRPTTINSLPVELFSRIFVVGASYDYLYHDSPFLLKPNKDYYPPPSSSFQTVVSHVCQRWRQIALRTSSLWSTIHLREPVHIVRATTYLQRCSTSSSIYLLDILVDTVAHKDHIPGVTLCRDEIKPIFTLLMPHIAHWRSFHLKVRDNDVKLCARHFLGPPSCPPAPSLETLQLYHFEDFQTPQNLWLATYRPPVEVFRNTLPRLRNVSLIGVNLPWMQSPYLVGLEKLELALHPDSIRMEYACWHRILTQSPQLRFLNLHYSGPRCDASLASSAAAGGGQVGTGGGGGNPEELVWRDADEKIVLRNLEELGLTDLDPDYLCELVQRLHLPAVRKMTWDLPEQDHTAFVDLITRKVDVVPSPIRSSSSSSSPSSGSKMSISSLVSSATSISEDDGDRPGDISQTIYTGPFPNISRLETLVLTALECNLQSWKNLLLALSGLTRLEADFSKLGSRFWEVFGGVLVPRLEVLKVAGVDGERLQREMKRRASLGCLRRWIVRWSEGTRGEDSVLDGLVQEGGCWVGTEMRCEAAAEGCERVWVQVETYEDDEDDEEEEGEEEEGEEVEEAENREEDLVDEAEDEEDEPAGLADEAGVSDTEPPSPPPNSSHPSGSDEGR
ncbi:hypothetical protein BKA70DRAFT_1384820 [Coprinopsis sp. MPI-PUGE-AT-0042]|nr:hypothetical protein BKA70DRAFT_1384820 [Coprinopsis sp. MPI-PUGE-AT-0042]